MNDGFILHHVQIAIPAGGEEPARAFYGELLGMDEVPKPSTLSERGGVWFRCGDAEIHLGVEEPFAPARKAHPALLVGDLPRLASKLRRAGHPVEADDLLPGFDRVYTADPFGNRIELLEAQVGDDPAALIEGRLRAQLHFLVEADRLKRVVRRTTLTDASRRENSAEHSWHLALFALVLAETAAEPIDVLRVVAMLLLHDLVEIDAGDTFAYDDAARAGQVERERAAAERLFGLLPRDQASACRELWEEFEGLATPESRFAKTIDRLQPILLNYASGGVAWREHDIELRQVLERNEVVAEGAPDLWALVQRLVSAAERRGWLR